MGDAEFWRLTVHMLVAVSMLGGTGFLIVWLSARDFDRRYGHGPK
jgi:hypothetical protein